MTRQIEISEIEELYSTIYNVEASIQQIACEMETFSKDVSVWIEDCGFVIEQVSNVRTISDASGETIFTIMFDESDPAEFNESVIYSGVVVQRLLK